MLYPYYTIEIVSSFPYTEPHFVVTTFCTAARFEFLKCCTPHMPLEYIMKEIRPVSAQLDCSDCDGRYHKMAAIKVVH
jgi:hypothetical protein